MRTAKISEVAHVTDFVASGSFASIKANVTYRSEKSYAILVRTTDYNNGWNGDYVWVDEHSFSFLSKSNLRPKDVIISNVGSIGIVFQTPDLGVPMSLAPNAIMCRSLDPETLDQDFLYYYLKGPIGQHLIHSITSGSAQPKFNKTDFRNLEIKVPAIERQRHIGNILKRLDDKIELNRKVNETLQQMVRALFKSWFIDFDPVHAKVAGRQPAGMDKATADLFPDSFLDSDLGKIPKGWKPGILDELVEPRAEKVAATPDKDSTRYVALEDMPSKSLDLSKYQLGSAVNSSIVRFRKGDILFGSMRVYFHKVGLACFDGITRTTTFVLKPRNEHLRHFSLLHLFSDEVIAFATTASIGTTIPYVRWDSLGKYRLAIPSDELLTRFDKLAGNLTNMIATRGEESQILTNLRDSLIRKLLSGDLSLEKNDTSA
jgi:type I restriction enzyme S subunit